MAQIPQQPPQTPRSTSSGPVSHNGTPQRRAGDRTRTHRFWRPAALVIGLAISLTVAGVVHDMLGQESQAQREISRQSLAVGLQTTIDRETDLLRSLRGLYDSSDFVSADEFRRFAQLDPNIRDSRRWLSVVWAPRNHGAPNRAGTEGVAMAPQDGFHQLYIQPESGSIAAPGADIAADPADRAIMLAAAESDSIKVTQPREVHLAGRTGTAIQAFLPVFKQSTAEQSAGGTRVLEGFLVQTVMLGGFFDNFLDKALADADLSVRIYDGERLIYTRGEETARASAGTLRIGDRDFRLAIDGTVSAYQSQFWLPALVLMIGLALTVLVYLRLLRADTEYLRVAHEVQQATAELAGANLRLADRSMALEQIADDLRQATQKAEIANAAKTKFLANMSHELRTPLNAVIGFSEMISGQVLGPASPRYVEYAEDIHKSGKFLLSIIEDLLDMSRIELGQFQLHEEITDLGALLEEVARVSEPRAKRKNIQVACFGFDALPRAMVDPRAIRQAMLNLLTNAIKFSGAGPPVEIGAAIGVNGAIELSVTDRGPGIKSDEIDHIFEPFWQAEAYRRQEKDGIGLGLAITKRLVEAHGGEIEVHSREGEGVRVVIRLPGTRIRRNAPRLSVVGGGGVSGGAA